MKKQTFLLIAGIYSLLIGVVLMATPDTIFQSYGFPTIEAIPHEQLIITARDFMFYTGANALGLGVLYILSRSRATSKTVFLTGTIVLILCAIFTIYRNAAFVTTAFAWVDMLVRLGIGLGFAYYYFTEKDS
jgi:hypothetical protein